MTHLDHKNPPSPQNRRSPTFLYTQIAQELRKKIELGTLQTGDKLPSLRALSQQRKVSIATATQAYLVLERQGYIQVRPQSGYYVLAPAELNLPTASLPLTKPSPVSRDQFIAKILDQSREKNIISLSSTVLDQSYLPIQRLNRLSSKCSADAEIYTYAPVQGLESLRRQIARRNYKDLQPTHATGLPRSISAEDVVITCGCMEALNLALRTVAQTGDIIAVESPTFYGILQAIECLGMQAIELPTDAQTGLDLAALEQALQTYPIKALLTVSNYQNPLGSCMPRTHKEALLNLSQKYDMMIIEDAIYSDFYFDQEPETLYTLDQHEQVILCSSFSKTLAPGLRVGWALPGRFRERFIQLKRMTSLSTATLPQMVVAEYLASGAYDRYLRRLRPQLQTAMQQLIQFITQAFPAGTRVSQPKGGMVIWVELPEYIDAMEVYQKALNQGLGIAPGLLFSNAHNYQNHLRLSCNRAWNRETEADFLRLADILREFTPTLDSQKDSNTEKTSD